MLETVPVHPADPLSQLCIVMCFVCVHGSCFSRASGGHIMRQSSTSHGNATFVNGRCLGSITSSFPQRCTTPSGRITNCSSLLFQILQHIEDLRMHQARRCLDDLVVIDLPLEAAVQVEPVDPGSQCVFIGFSTCPARVAPASRKRGMWCWTNFECLQG